MSENGVLANLRDRLLGRTTRKDGWSYGSTSLILNVTAIIIVLGLMVASEVSSFLVGGLKLTTDGWYLLTSVLVLSVLGIIFVWASVSMKAGRGDWTPKALAAYVGGVFTLVGALAVLLLGGFYLGNIPTSVLYLHGGVLAVGGLAAIGAGAE